MSGLSAPELAGVLDELREELAGATVLDATRLRQADDLLLWLEDAHGRRRALHVAPGGSRARVCITTRRFGRQQRDPGAGTARLGDILSGTRLIAIEHTPGERWFVIRFEGAGDHSDAALAVELFGPRGLWCAMDGDGRIVELSRLPNTAARVLRPGAVYEPPPSRDKPTSPPAPERFGPPWSERIDAHFTALDEQAATAHRCDDLQRALSRWIARLDHRLAGLQRQAEEVERAPALRRKADLLLAYGFSAAPGATELVVPDPDVDGAELRLELAPDRPVRVQAEALYRRARKLEEAVAVNARRREQCHAERERAERLAERLAAAETDADLDAIARALADAGVLPRPPKPPAPAEAKLNKALGGEDFRRYHSTEGHLILVGRNNRQNDRLSVRVARGNDLWLHVGRGYAGSHVVVRLPRGKTASLDTLLDAGTLAVHFSKARGSARCEVMYTQAKNVRKPKGLPPGAVVPSRTKTLVVDRDDARLRRLLDQGTGNPASGDPEARDSGRA